MVNKCAAAVLVLVFFAACQSGKETRNLKKFVEEYILVKEQYAEKMSGTAPGGQRAEFQKEKTARLEQLLTKYDNLVSSDSAELLKSKLLMEMSRFKEAEEKINRLTAKKSHLTNDVILAKVQVLIYRRQVDEALKIFKTIEDKIKPGLELSSVYLYLALYSSDGRMIEEYGRKFLNSPRIPEELTGFEADVYRKLSAAAAERNDSAAALDMLNKAISITTGREKKALLETELAQLQLTGKPAPPISAETWINGNPPIPDALKGKVVVIDFWAPWCASSRELIPTLVKLHNEYKDQGLVIIGLTRLYGTYNDDTGKKGLMDKPGEIEEIKAFVLRHSIPYLTAVASEGNDSESYKITALPTLVFIGKDGNVDYIRVGAGREQFIKNKIKTLMEVK